MSLQALVPPDLVCETAAFVDEAWPVFAWVRTDRLAVDRRYQRGSSRRSARLVERIARGFDPAAFGALICRQAGEAIEVIDGQHRALAAMAIGLPSVPALMLGKPGAARFLAINFGRVNLTPLQRHRAAAAAGEPAAIEIDRIVAEAGLKLGVRSGNNPPVGTLDCVGLLGRVLARPHGPLVLEAVLSALAEAGQEDGAYLAAQVIRPATDFGFRLVAESGEALPADLDLLPATLADGPEIADEARRRAARMGGRPRDHACQLMAAEHARLGGTEIAVGW